MQTTKQEPTIVSLRIKNFLSISDVEIRPGQVNQIVGKNNNGKTSVIRALDFAIKGDTDSSLVKMGTEAAEVVIELADETTIRRRLSAEGKQTVDVRRSGFAAPKPQAYLDNLFDKAAFNPLELLDPKRRTDAILAAIDMRTSSLLLANELQLTEAEMPPLDYSQHALKVLEQAHKYFYQRRAEANRDAADKKKRWETHASELPQIIESKTTKADIEKLMAQTNAKISEQEEKIRQAESQLEKAREARARVERYQGTVDQIQEAIAAKQSELKALEARLEQGKAAVKDAEKEVPEMLPDTSGLDKELGSYLTDRESHKVAMVQLEKIDSVRKQHDMVKDREREYLDAQAFADSLTARVEALAGPIKAKIMAEAEMPVKGLEYRDGAFLVDGVAVDNLSASKALQLAIGVARKHAKATKLICIDGAELLDQDTYAALEKEIQNDGFTYFLTKVGEPFEAQGSVFRMKEGAIQ